MHHKACLAAYAARCVFQKKGFDSFKKIQDYLFENQEFFDKKSIQEKVLSTGISKDDFEKCLDSKVVKQEIADEIELGKSLGLDSTPSIYVNGRFLKMGANPDVLQSVLKEILKK
jgi:protein-disulfide isomerase